MTFTATDSRNAKTDSWLTPIPLVRKLGHFDLDPCGYPGHPTAERLITLPNDGFFAINGRIQFIPTQGQDASQPGTGSILIPFGYRNRAAIIKSEIKGIWFNAGWAYGIDEAWK